MRSRIWTVLVVLAACGSGSSSSTTSGPIETIVKETPTAVRVKAVHHKLSLTDLPVGSWLGLPVSGALELDAAVEVPIVDGVRDYRKATGTIAIRCIDTCRIGDDDTRLKPPPSSRSSASSAAFLGDGIAISHIDLTAFEAEATIADGHARLTHWRLASTDLELDFSLSFALARAFSDSRIDGCIRLRPTDALRQRDPRTHDLLSLMTPTVGPDDRHHLQLAGTVDAPRMLSRLCGETP